MLHIIGVGLWDENDISIRGLELCKKSDVVYAELYTNVWHGDIRKLEAMAGKKIQALSRSDLEDGLSALLERAEKTDVCLLVPGDALAATTHFDILDEARKRGIAVDVVHNASIFSAVAECGLHLYKFGATATVPLPEKTGGVQPDSVYDAIKRNKAAGLHTLLLLDIGLGVPEGIRVLMDIEKQRREGVLEPDGRIVVMSQLGSSAPVIAYGNAAALMKVEFGLPAVIVVPGPLHFREKECLEQSKI